MLDDLLGQEGRLSRGCQMTIGICRDHLASGSRPVSIFLVKIPAFMSINVFSIARTALGARDLGLVTGVWMPCSDRKVA